MSTTGISVDGSLTTEPFFDQGRLSHQQRQGATDVNQNATIMGSVLQANFQGFQQGSVACDGNSKGGVSSLGQNSGMSLEGIRGFNN